jgi:hypothetical protein
MRSKKYHKVYLVILYLSKVDDDESEAIVFFLSIYELKK